MEKKIFAEKLIEYAGEEITDLFLLKRIGQRISQDGKKDYIELCFLDKTGEFTGYIYGDYMKPEYFSYKKRVVLLTGQIIVRKNASPKMYISFMEEAEQYEDADYYNGLNPEEEELYKEIIRQYTQKISHKNYQKLVSSIYEDYQERIVHCPANLIGYNNYNGGILAHTVAVTGVAVYGANILSKYCRGQKEIDFNLLVTAALLHEVGKIEEYTTFPLAQRISEGVLISTSETTARMVWEAIYRHEILLTKEEENLLYHLICVCGNEHHFIRPMCTEAVILQNAYQMQTRVEALGFFLEENKQKSGSIYDTRLDNYVYVRKKEGSKDEKHSGRE